MKPSTIYLIRKRALGDVLWIEPVVDELSKQYKKVIVYTKFTALFFNYPAKNVVFKDKLNLFEKILICIDQILNTSNFSINLDNSYEKDPFKPLLEAYFSKAGLAKAERYPKLYLSEEERKNSIPGKSYVVVHLKAASASKNFRNAYGIEWAFIIKYLQNSGFSIIEIGDFPGTMPEFYKNTSIREMIGLISQASLFIGIDSGPSHIAASLQIPSILFFGAINPHFRHFPSKFKGIILQQFCEFAGCYHRNPIAFKHHECKLVGDAGIPKCCLFTTEQVIQSIDELIHKYDIKHV